MGRVSSMFLSLLFSCFFQSITYVASTTSTLLVSPKELNKVRFADDSLSLHGHIDIYLRKKKFSGETELFDPTPTDLKGPFHIAPEKIPENFPLRKQACGKTGFENEYKSGIPLVLTGTVRDTVTGNVIEDAETDSKYIFSASL